MMEDGEDDDPITATETQSESSNKSNWSNGQCIVALPSCSALNPAFDLTVCRSVLEREGFQIPVADMEAALSTALDLASVRRYMLFNSAIFHFIMAPVLYMVTWCAVFSTLHRYVPFTDYWVLCLSVSLLSIFLTSLLTFILHRSNKEINVNVDVRLIQVNERMVKHKVLVGVADWVQNCTGNMKLYFVYWDVLPCLNALTETLEEFSFVSTDVQNKLSSRMSHLVLVTELVLHDENSDDEESGEQRPLLRSKESASCSPSSSQRGHTGVNTSYSLIPEASLPVQDKSYQLLMTYSATYVKLLASQRLSGRTHQRAGRRLDHCATAPLCLCQYVAKKILR